MTDRVCRIAGQLQSGDIIRVVTGFQHEGFTSRIADLRINIAAVYQIEKNDDPPTSGGNRPLCAEWNDLCRATEASESSSKDEFPSRFLCFFVLGFPLFFFAFFFFFLVGLFVSFLG